MALLKSLTLALVCLSLVPVASAEPARPRAAETAKKPATPAAKRPLPRRAPAARKATTTPVRRPAAAQARPAQLISRPTSSPPSLGSGGGGQLWKNSAPEGSTERERALQRQLDGILDSAWLKSAINGVHVLDAKTGQVLYSYAADRQLNPASNTKLISTAAALDVLGADFTYETRLLGPAPDAGGVVRGDVVLLGSGDPTLRASHLGELAAALKQRGVTRVEGDVVVSSDDRDGLAHPYVRVTVTGAGRDGERPTVRLHPDSAYFTLDNRATTAALPRKRQGGVSVSTVRLGGEGAQVKVAVAGKLRRGQQVSVVRPVPKPVLFTGFTMRAALLNAGITVTGDVRQVAKRPAEGGLAELATHESVPLRQLAAMINKPSNNYLADRVIMTTGAHRYGGETSMQKGIRVMADWLERIGIEPGSYRLENGSGLSHVIHVSARQIATVLMAGSRDERIGRDWIESFAIGGVDGTLRARFAGRPAAGYVYAKTGTLNGVSALSGFVTLSDDASVCFAVLTSGFRNSRARKNQIREGQAMIANAIFDYLRARHGEPTGSGRVLQASDGAGDEDVEGEETPLGNDDVEL
jgi:serine-type D-Ala-D-Ala carboxypeptidase/endopeptidase (penicillin-binding protein 4)